MARLADSLLPINAGIEVSVAATKSYMAQLFKPLYSYYFIAENINSKENGHIKRY